MSAQNKNFADNLEDEENEDDEFARKNTAHSVPLHSITFTLLLPTCTVYEMTNHM